MEKSVFQKKLAIICPVLNCLDYTKQFIDSIRCQTPYVLIFIDNGSTDGTEEYFKQFKGSNDVQYIRFPSNIGVAPAWNFGITRAIYEFESEYFLICNNDIQLRHDTIDKLLEKIKNENVALCTPKNVFDPQYPLVHIEEISIPKNELTEEHPDFSCFMLKKETIDKVGYFDEKFFPAYFEDNDYHYRINLAGLKAIQTNQAIHYHFKSQTIKNNDDIFQFSNSQYLKNQKYYCDKWGGKPTNEAYDKPFNR